MYIAEEIQRKWAPVIDHPDMDAIKDPYKKLLKCLALLKGYETRCVS